jgi:signal transduction protein with GAF and PtsI domain
MQVVERDDTSSGALATPLLAADSCVGVLSAELGEGWESSESVQATLAIMAAQLATLLSSDPPADAAVPPVEAQG